MDVNELERQLLLKIYYRAVEVVNAWHPGTHDEVDALRSAVKSHQDFLEVKKEAESAERAAQMVNVAGRS